MTSDEAQNRIEALRQRWEADPSSRVFVQLADEYRRAGQTEEAVKVLEAGLERQPGYTSAQVALARCRLTLGQAGRAVEMLDGVVTRDPGHLLANKLLVEAHLEAGREEQARQRLEVYRMIADADPELEELEQRLASLGEAPEPPETPQPLAGSEPAAAPAPPEPEEEGGDIFGLGAPVPAPPAEAGGDLAGQLGGLGELDLSPTEAAASPAPEAPETPRPRPETPETSETPTSEATEPAPGKVPEDDPFGDLLAGEQPPVAALPDHEDDLFGLAPAADLPPAAPAPEPPAPEAPSQDASGPDSGSAEPPTAAEAVAETKTETETETAETETEEKATVTLGQLYLAQGHLEEAERIFRRVLRREPDYPAAHQALAELQRRQAGVGVAPEGATPDQVPARPAAAAVADDEAEELSASADEPWPAFPVPPEILAEKGLTSRKVALLQHYLDRLRAER